MKPGLYCIATPIGNLKDITLRAIETLNACDVIACEDTRVSGVLLKHYGINKTLWSYHDHNGEMMRPKIMEAIHSGKKVALISDAGTPLISDPGTKLVRECQQANLYVTTIPGPSAVISALLLSGFVSHAFCFIGFFNDKTAANYFSFNGNIILFESPRRLQKTLNILSELFHNREVAVVREITKLYEETVNGTYAHVIEHFGQHEPRGEIVIVLSAPLADETVSADTIDDALRTAMKTLSVKDAAQMVAQTYKLPRKEVYKLALAIK